MSSNYGERRRYIFDLKKQRHYGPALSEIEALRAEGCQAVELDVDHADVLGRLGRHSEALEILERNPVSQLSEYGRTLLAGLLEKAERLAEAEAIFEDLAGRPQLSALVARRVIVYLEKKDPDRAINLARRVAEPTAAAQLSLGQTLLKADRRGEALAVLAAAVEKFPDDELLVKEHVMAQLHGLEPEEQAGELETLLSMKAHRGNEGLQERLLQAYRKAGRNQDARRLLMELLEKNPHSDYYRSNLAYVLRELGEIDTGLDLLEQVLTNGHTDAASNAYFATCAKHDRKNRAAAFVARVTQQDPTRRPMWGILKKYFPR